MFEQHIRICRLSKDFESLSLTDSTLEKAHTIWMRWKKTVEMLVKINWNQSHEYHAVIDYCCLFDCTNSSSINWIEISSNSQWKIEHIPNYGNWEKRDSLGHTCPKRNRFKGTANDACTVHCRKIENIGELRDLIYGAKNVKCLKIIKSSNCVYGNVNA